MKCPGCGAARLIHATRKVAYTYKGESTAIPAVSGDFCPACDEAVLDREQGDRYSEWVGAFQRQVNAAFVDPGFTLKARADNLSWISARRQEFRWWCQITQRAVVERRLDQCRCSRMDFAR